MFRQIAPGGIVNKEIMNRKVDKVDALDQAKPDMDGVKIAQAYNDPTSEHGKDAVPEQTLPKHQSNSTGEAADAYVPHQGAETEKSAEAETFHDASTTLDPAQQITKYAAQQKVDAGISKPETNFEEKLSDTSSNSDKSWEKVDEPNASDREATASAPTNTELTNAATESQATLDATTPSKSIYTSAVSGAKEPILTAASDPEFVDEQRKFGTQDAIDEHLESSSAEVHPFPHTAEDDVKPAPGEAVIAAADSEETKMTHEEMSALEGAGGCPFLMNRE